MSHKLADRLCYSGGVRTFLWLAKTAWREGRRADAWWHLRKAAWRGLRWVGTYLRM